MSISTCALREEGDPAIIKITASHSGFLSTPSARRATVSFCWFPKTANYFYPRPPRGGRRRPSVSSLQTCDFYPRPPRGGRRHGFCIKRGKNLFLSTPSARRATSNGLLNVGGQAISIHALREEGDVQRPAERRRTGNFYPRPPRGGRHTKTAPKKGATRISIHALREEGDHSTAAAPGCPGYFYPRPPRGGRRYLARPERHDLRISIHALREEGDRV